MKVGDKFHGSTVVHVDRTRGVFTTDRYTVPGWRPGWRDVLRWVTALAVVGLAVWGTR